MSRVDENVLTELPKFSDRMGFVVYPRSQQYIPGINCSFHRGSRMAEATFCPVTRIFQESVCRRVKRSQVMLCLFWLEVSRNFALLKQNISSVWGKTVHAVWNMIVYTGLQSFLMQSHWFNEADCTHIILVSSYDITTNYIYYRIYLNKH